MVNRHELGRTVAECKRRFASLSQDELVCVLHASSYELARRADQTPRTVAEALFASMPSDDDWWRDVLPVVIEYGDDD
ncbi:MAG: hypothetical protein ACE5EV_07845, partial [Gaiellales bacterium]